MRDIPLSPPGSRQSDDDDFLHHGALGPWRETGDVPLEPRPPPRTKPAASQRSNVSPRSSPRSSNHPNHRPLSLSSSPRKLDATPLTDAYRTLIDRTDALELSLSARSDARREASAALRAGIANLSQPLVEEQKRLLRFQALKNEVDIFQQHLDPFIFEIKTPREHEVRSSVYRHFTRMRAVQDMGVPIYGIGDYAHEPTDKVIVPRAGSKFYRRIRRRNAAHFLDTDLIPRPEVRSRKPNTNA